MACLLRIVLNTVRPIWWSEAVSIFSLVVCLVESCSKCDGEFGTLCWCALFQPHKITTTWRRRRHCCRFLEVDNMTKLYQEETGRGLWTHVAIVSASRARVHGKKSFRCYIDRVIISWHHDTIIRILDTMHSCEISTVLANLWILQEWSQRTSVPPFKSGISWCEWQATLWLRVIWRPLFF